VDTPASNTYPADQLEVISRIIQEVSGSCNFGAGVPNLEPGNLESHPSPHSRTRQIHRFFTKSSHFFTLSWFSLFTLLALIPYCVGFLPV
jgi:hypothetical protein